VFLIKKLKLKLHEDKTKTISLSKVVDFVGFRNYYHYKLPRKRNILSMKRKIDLFNKYKIPKEKFFQILNGWIAYVKWSNSHNLIKNF